MVGETRGVVGGQEKTPGNIQGRILPETPRALRPTRCRNSTVTSAHAPIWLAEEEDLIAMSKDRRLASPRREAVLIELADVQRITRAFKDQKGSH
ncbi:hypothetical protein OHA98_41495 [Streptomyces sp. NBC_00654]|uniref:hypothetical protein n=1 Tax=Streptomyces sp. NBC_00654 TaxID=2975799 RepID=UPI002251672D|nr:hypothetical protein [Streptomyces sp. NBC_00654]MCX4971089.1 hypothetical protein [Streptomyces sp. NBC_00654]